MTNKQTNYSNSSSFPVLPLSAVSWTAFYLYNKNKNLPHKVSRYVLIGFGAYIIGKYSYRDELKRRLVQNRSNTPFMQALRKGFNLNPVVATDGYGTDSVMEYRGRAGNDSSDWDNTELSADRLPEMGNPRQPAFDQPLQQQPPPSPPYESGNYRFDPPQKEAASYDELRARNRGLIR